MYKPSVCFPRKLIKTKRNQYNILNLGIIVYFLNSQLVLEEIIGLTTKNGNGLASNISTANCAYVAGCVVVVYNVDSGTQSHLIASHRVPKPLSCVAMSKDGRFVAAGEV
jgi:hypothetical protein